MLSRMRLPMCARGCWHTLAHGPYRLLEWAVAKLVITVELVTHAAKIQSLQSNTFCNCKAFPQFNTFGLTSLPTRHTRTWGDAHARIHDAWP